MNKFHNTTGTVKLTSTISNPNAKSVIWSLSSILKNQIEEDFEEERVIEKSSPLYVFSEEKYIEQKPEEFDEERIELLKCLPSLNNIYEFIKALYDCAQFSIECCIINKTEVPLQPTNWRTLVFIAIIIAQKVTDDHFIKNADFA